MRRNRQTKTTIAIVMFLVVLLFSVSVNAATTLLTYDGWNLLGIPTIGNFTLSVSTPVTITNEIYQANYPNAVHGTVAVQKKGVLYWSDWTTYHQYGLTTQSFYPTLPAGLWRLYLGSVPDLLGGGTANRLAMRGSVIG